MKYRIQKNRLRQITGISLIELLITVLLSSFLLIITVNLYFGTKKTEQLATTALKSQTEARNALHVLRQSIELAGFSSEVSNPEAKKLAFPANAQFAAGQVMRIVGNNNNQTLSVRLQGDPELPIRACNGNTVALGNTAAQTSYEFSLNDGKLICQIFEDNTEIGDAITIANNVVAFRLRAASTVNNVLTTQVQNEIPLIADQPIKGIHVQLVLRSERSIRTNPKRTQIKVTGFDDLEFNDEFLYTESSHYFLAQNQ